MKPVTFNAYPLDCPPLIEDVLGIYGDVVLGLTSDDTGLTADTFGDVDDHPPFFFFFRHLFSL